MCGLMSDLVICKFRKSMVIHDTECPYRDQVSLNNINPFTIKALHPLLHIVSLLQTWFIETEDLQSKFIDPGFLLVKLTSLHTVGNIGVMFSAKEVCALQVLWLVISSAKEVIFFLALVCLFVCLFVDNITQKVMNGSG